MRRAVDDSNTAVETAKEMRGNETFLCSQLGSTLDLH